MVTAFIIARLLGPGRNGLLVAAMIAFALLVASMKVAPQAATGTPPDTLSETGLYADTDTLTVDTRHLAFAPQYPLWTDGAAKRRWISLPPGTAIDGTDPDAWVFPAGTRLWKEFAFAGARVETRFMERQADGQWLYAAYAWSADGREAKRVPDGVRRAYALGGNRFHAIPSANDCKACHQAGRSEVLGFGTIQLSAELESLIARGLLAGLPEAAREAPQWNAASSATERAALGYLHGNCGHCHNADGALANVGLFLRQTANAAPTQAPAIASTFGEPVRKPAPGLPAAATLRIAPQHPERSALMQRMASRYPPLQMPPLGTVLVDREAVDLIARWIAESEPLSPQPPHQPRGESQ